MRALVTVLALALGVGGARADEPPTPPDLRARVAEALFERGATLYRVGQYQEALTLLQESVAQQPDGAYAAAARSMIRTCQQRLGLPVDPEPTPAPAPAPAPLDPYADPGGGAVLDPYADDKPPARLDAKQLEPYGDSGLPPVPGYRDQPVERGRLVPTQLYVLGGTYGVSVGVLLAIIAENEDLWPLALVTGGAGVAGAWLADRRHRFEEGEITAIASGAAWGGALFAAIAHLSNASKAAYYGDAILLGSALGLGGGGWFALSRHPGAGDVALVNSLGGYGVATGLLLGVVMQPYDDRAYTVNALLGGLAGLGTGFLLAPRSDVSRARVAIIDLCATGGAAAGFLLFSLAASGGDANRDGQVGAAGALIGLAGGGVTGWLLTRRYDDRKRPRAAPAPAALLSLDDDGRWRLGPPAFVPVGRSLGLSVAAGRF